MPYVIAEPCINVKDKACVEVCPVDCIYEGADQLFIHPDECIDCGACEPVCPVKAIFAEDEVPDQWKQFIESNRQFFKDNPGVQPASKK
jgi:NAD-dependent dihydropyrimidine dehydrogenase PreA subunit